MFKSDKWRFRKIKIKHYFRKTFLSRILKEANKAADYCTRSGLLNLSFHEPLPELVEIIQNDCVGKSSIRRCRIVWFSLYYQKQKKINTIFRLKLSHIINLLLFFFSISISNMRNWKNWWNTLLALDEYFGVNFEAAIFPLAAVCKLVLFPNSTWFMLIGLCAKENEIKLKHACPRRFSLYFFSTKIVAHSAQTFTPLCWTQSLCYNFIKISFTISICPYCIINRPED